MVILPVREVEQGKINYLFDTGATTSLLKLKMLKETTKNYRKIIEKIKLTGITGHTITTLRRTYVMIKTRDDTIRSILCHKRRNGI